MQPRGRQAEDDVAGADRGPVDDVSAFDHTEAAARGVELSLVHQPRMLGRLAADQRTACLAAAGRDRADQLGHPLGNDMPDRDVVEEGQRLGAAADDVVGAHRDEVDADRVVPVERPGDRGLGPDPVGRGDQQRLAIAGRDRDRAPEPAQPTDDLGSTSRLDVGTHEIHRPLAGRDVHPGRQVGGPVGDALRPGHQRITASSSMNLRLAASYGTGSG